MRLTPEVLPMLQLRNCQLTLLTSLAFGAVLAVFSAPLTAQTTQDLPKTIPNLSGYDSETRQTMELACSADRGNPLGMPKKQSGLPLFAHHGLEADSPIRCLWNRLNW
jgi:hypothetical protein